MKHADFSNGVKLIGSMDSKPLMMFNAPSSRDRSKFVADLKEAIQSAATAAAKGAEKTATMVAKAGRAAYCKDRNEDSNPDAGAVMIAKLFAALQKA